MTLRILNLQRWLFVAVAAVFAASPAFAEVTRVDIQRREDVLNGKSFGTAGPYEKLVGRVYFAVDPANPHNRIIADIDKAPRNAEGKVEFSSDLYIIKPKDAAKGNGVVFFDIVNRGNKQLLRSFSRGGGAADPSTEADFGDAYLLNQGYTLVAVGWQFDVAKGRGLVGTEVPVATDNGKTITGWVKMWFISNEPVSSYAFVTGYNTSAYPPLDLNDPRYRLTVREGIFAPQRLIPREEWQFARVDNGKPVADPKSIYMKTGFRAGLTYEIAYETKDPPVAGLGLAAVRDMASALKFNAGSVAPGRFAYMYGASQTGRLIRQLIYEGFTIDEQGRKAFDAAFVQTGATGLGSFNERFAQPNEHTDEVPDPLSNQHRSRDRARRRPGGSYSRRAGAEDDARRHLFRVLGSRTRCRSAPHDPRRERRCRGRAERPRVPVGGNETRRGQFPACRQRRGVQRELQRLPLGTAWSAGSARRVGAKRHAATAKRSSQNRGPDAGAAGQFEIPRHSRRQMAGHRSRRLPRRRAGAVLGTAVPGAEGRH
jgi:hypothetical protein